MCLCGGAGGCGVGVGGVVDGSGGNSGVSDGGASGMYRSGGVGGSGGAGGSVVHGSVGGGLCRSGWYFGIGCGFCGRWSGAGGGVCCYRL